ncbi:hypothetical protein BN77_p2180062 [Rhizobium mesoamericanum STM3625]|uniref:Uncharacterized protein n=1 Tax=Rhizobium mesoamericanum STM3625 TaxID=1211777 RepID=K0Q1C6_9HYPH|nr:hypothetical protein BN77_p2180062 [Rhizobium mesoamericanum STM3625]
MKERRYKTTSCVRASWVEPFQVADPSLRLRFIPAEGALAMVFLYLARASPRRRASIPPVALQ